MQPATSTSSQVRVSVASVRISCWCSHTKVVSYLTPSRLHGVDADARTYVYVSLTLAETMPQNKGGTWRIFAATPCKLVCFYFFSPGGFHVLFSLFCPQVCIARVVPYLRCAMCLLSLSPLCLTKLGHYESRTCMSHVKHKHERNMKQHGSWVHMVPPGCAVA